MENFTNKWKLEKFYYTEKGDTNVYGIQTHNIFYYGNIY